MSWTYDSGNGKVTSSGGSESSPNKISDAVSTVIASDNTKGAIYYHNDGSTVRYCKLIDTEIEVDAGSWISIDQDVEFALEGQSHFTWVQESSNNANDGGSLVMEERSAIIVDTDTNNYTESTTRFNNGCNVTIKKDKYGVSPRVVLKAAKRHDILTFSGQKAGKIDIQGLNIHQIAGANPSLKWFMNYCRNIVNFKDITFDSNGEVFQLIYCTIKNPVVKTESLSSTSRSGSQRYTYVKNPTYIWSSDHSWRGNIRAARYSIINPRWGDSGNWDGGVNFGAVVHDKEPRLWILYEEGIKAFKAADSTALQGAKVYFERVVNGTDYYSGNVTDYSATYTDTTDSSGEVNRELLDAYCQITNGVDTKVTDVERYKWSAQIRHYNYLYSSQYIFKDRIFGRDVSGVGEQADTTYLVDDAGVTKSETDASNLTEAANFSDIYDIVKVSWIDGTHWDIDIPVTKSGSVLDFGNGTVELDSTASAVFAISGTTTTIKANSAITTSTKYDEIKAGIVKYKSTNVPDSSNYTGDVYIDSEQDLTDVTIDGNLHINTGANSTLDFSNVNVTGDVYNDDGSHTLTINSLNGSSLTAHSPGTGNGEVDIVNAVTISFHVTDSKTGNAVENAHIAVLKKSDKTVLFTGNTDSNGDFNHTYNYAADVEYVGWVRQHDLQGTDYVEKSFSGTITNNDLSLTFTLTPKG